MAKLEQTLSGSFNQILNKIEQGILNGSMSASLEESSDFHSGDARCSVRVFERYSYSGGNRVSLSVTLFQNAIDITFPVRKGGEERGTNGCLSRIKNKRTY